jgi:hypothetical protein
MAEEMEKINAIFRLHEEKEKTASQKKKRGQRFAYRDIHYGKDRISAYAASVGRTRRSKRL